MDVIIMVSKEQAWFTIVEGNGDDGFIDKQGRFSPFLPW